MASKSAHRIHPFLQAMVPEHRAVVLQGAEDKTLAAGEVLFREGYPANRLYLIHEGSVALETHVHGKGDVLIATVSHDQVVGWSWLVAPFVWSFQGRTVEPTHVTVLDGGHLLIASERNHFLGYELLKGISKVMLDALLVAHQRWLDTGHRPVIKTSEVASAIDPSLSLAERIAAHPFFHGLAHEYLNTFAGLASVKECEAGQVVFRTGEPADGLYVVERGRLLVEASDGGDPRPIQVVGGGDAVGWSSFCAPYEWHFDGRALEPLSALFFKAADLRERSAANYHFGYDVAKRITRMMLKHLQSTRQRMWEAMNQL